MECGYELGLPDFKALSTTPYCFSDFLKSLTIMGELRTAVSFLINSFSRVHIFSAWHTGDSCALLVALIECFYSEG